MKSWWTRISVGMLTLLGIVVLASCTSLGTVGVPSLGGVAQERRSQGSGVGVAEGESGPGEESVGFSKRGWRTDFSKRNVSLSEIKGGGPPKDGIPPIDKPKFVDAQQAGAWLGEKEPVGYLNLGGEAKAYPLQILTWHEIVNDTVGGQPVSMTFCPLCNTVLAFDRRLDGRFLDFGTTGNLRLSDLVMYDRQTESWWQQAVGEAIIGELTGKKLVFLPAGVISFREFREAFPKGLVLSRDTGFDRDYGRNPYAGYDSRNNTPFLFFGSLDRRALPMERVVAVSIGSEDVAYTFTFLEKNRVVNDTISGEPIVVFYKPGTISALDASAIAKSREVGAGVVFSPEVNGKRLTFMAKGDDIIDQETGSQWNLAGRAVKGSLAGTELKPLVHGNHFWFAWVAFKPKTQIRES